MLTQAELKKRLTYNPETGEWRWNESRCGRAMTGRLAGNVHHTGYLTIRLDGRNYQTHRLAFLYMLGRWPGGDVDHKNRNRSDCRWENLREATRSQNIANSKVSLTSRTGIKGVSLCRHGRARYAATVRVAGKQKQVGRFICFGKAVAAARDARKTSYGEFA